VSTAGSGAGSRVAYEFRHGRDRTISYPVTADGIRTRVVECGTGERVLVCLHGAGSRADRFGPVMPGLADAGWHVFALDFPGHGFADKGPGPDYSAPGFSRFVAGVLDALGLSGVTVAGTSLGGHVAARLARERTDLVDRLVLIGATGIVPTPVEVMPQPEAISDASPESVRRKLTFLVSDPALLSEDWVREESMINSSAGAREALYAVGTSLNTRSNNDLQAEGLRELALSAPVLLVWGEDDAWVPVSVGAEAHAALPGSVLELMPGAGHAPYFEDPDRFVAILQRHFGYA
jgi:2-hydroxy-6-oxonona-2,4-dienedioate hydrolase